MFSLLRHKNKCPQCGKVFSNSDTSPRQAEKPLFNNTDIPPITPTTLPNEKASTSPQEPIRKPCPHCSEMVMETAKICPFCKQAILSFDPQKNATQTIIFGGLAFVLIFFGLTYCAMWEVENITMPWAEKQVEKQMKEAEKDVDRLMRKYR